LTLWQPQAAATASAQSHAKRISRRANRIEICRPERAKAKGTKTKGNSELVRAAKGAQESGE
jgi:hypothetical protein